MILISKLIAILFAVLVISKTYHDYKKKQEIFSTFVFWTVTWLIIVYLALDPSIIIKINAQSGGSAGLGTIFGIAFISLFFVTYRVYIKANRLERKLKDIVMKIGLKDLEKLD